MYIYKAKPVATRADIEKEIEKETAFLMYMDGYAHDQARIKAQEFVNTKYAEVIARIEKEKK